VAGLGFASGGILFVFIGPSSAFIGRNTVFIARNTVFIGRDTVFIDRDTVFIDRETVFIDRETAFIGRETVFIGRNTVFIEPGTIFIGRDTVFIGPNTGFKIANIRRERRNPSDADMVGLAARRKTRPQSIRPSGFGFTVSNFSCLCRNRAKFSFAFRIRLLVSEPGTHSISFQHFLFRHSRKATPNQLFLPQCPTTPPKPSSASSIRK
jgi:hypothetical protein